MSTVDKKRKIKRDMTNVNIVLTVFAVIGNILIYLAFLNVTRYSNFSKGIFLAVNIIALLILLIVNVLLIIFIKTRKAYLMNTLIVFLVICVAFGGVGFVLTNKVNSTVNKVTASGSTSTSSTVQTSIVLYSNDGNVAATDINGLDGRTIGIVSGTSNAESAQEEFNAEGVMVSYEEYTGYNDLLLALFEGNVDAAALPSNYMDTYGMQDGFAEYLAKSTSIATFDKTVTVSSQGGADKDLTSEPFTVLVIGVADGLSDSIMLASVNPISLKVTLTSIARDSYVPIACYAGGASDKINAAYSRGRDCLIDTVEKLTGVEVDYFVESNFQGVVDMVDAVGGIVVNNPYEFIGQNASSERGHMTVWVPAGENVVLDGEQALAFARERHLYATGDFQRQANQQTVIQAIIRKVLRTRDLNTALKVMDAAGTNVQTNFTTDQLIDFFNYVMKKANRFYDQEHIEQVFEIVGSRITGYNSGLWSDSLQMSLYIYRLYEGSLADTRAAIEDNLGLETAPTTGKKSFRWDATWKFTPPTLSNETYAEQIIQSEVPDTIGDFVGRNIGVLQSWASTFGVTVNIQYIYPGDASYNATVAEGTIMSQDVASGTSASAIGAINVTVMTHANNTSTTCSAANIAACKDQTACEQAGGAWNGSACGTKPVEASPTPSETPVTCPANSTWNGSACVCNSGYHDDGSGGCAADASVPPTTETPTETPTESPTPVPACNSGDQSGCTAENCVPSGGAWDGSVCTFGG